MRDITDTPMEFRNRSETGLLEGRALRPFFAFRSGHCTHRMCWGFAYQNQEKKKEPLLAEIDSLNCSALAAFSGSGFPRRRRYAAPDSPTSGQLQIHVLDTVQEHDAAGNRHARVEPLFRTWRRRSSALRYAVSIARPYQKKDRDEDQRHRFDEQTIGEARTHAAKVLRNPVADR